jgi:hypothetical protein
MEQSLPQHKLQIEHPPDAGWRLRGLFRMGALIRWQLAFSSAQSVLAASGLSLTRSHRKGAAGEAGGCPRTLFRVSGDTSLRDCGFQCRPRAPSPLRLAPQIRACQRWQHLAMASLELRQTQGEQAGCERPCQPSINHHHIGDSPKSPPQPLSIHYQTTRQPEGAPSWQSRERGLTNHHLLH